MKTYIKNLFKTIVFQIISLLLIFGCVFVYAVSFPSSGPSGQATGGNFMNYFNKILVTTGSTNTGVVRIATTVTRLTQGDCGVGQAIQGFDDDGNKICVTITTP